MQQDVNIEELMQEIRRQILAKRATSTEGEDTLQVPVGGRRFGAEYYDHLYQAGLTYNQITARHHQKESNVPILGGIINWARRQFHELVLFYVNQVAAQQTRFNTHILKALSILSEELEYEEAGPEQS